MNYLVKSLVMTFYLTSGIKYKEWFPYHQRATHAMNTTMLCGKKTGLVEYPTGASDTSSKVHLPQQSQRSPPIPTLSHATKGNVAASDSVFQPASQGNVDAKDTVSHTASKGNLDAKDSVSKPDSTSVTSYFEDLKSLC